MQLQRVSVLLLPTLFLLAALGCGTDSAEQVAGYQVTDAAGQTVVFEKKPVRVLNYALWLDDVVLGLVPPERLVGIDHLADDPNSSNIAASRRRSRSLHCIPMSFFSMRAGTRRSRRACAISGYVSSPVKSHARRRRYARPFLSSPLRLARRRRGGR